MNEHLANEGHGTLTEPATLTIRRRLPGPIETVWAYLTDADLRRTWLAGGALEQRVGAEVEFVWRNDELSDPPGQRPPGFAEEQRMQSVITECDPPHRLSFSWNGTGDVTFVLEPQGKDVVLTLVHREIGDRSTRLLVGPGWHMHLDILVARMAGLEPVPFWDGWSRLRAEYDARLPA